MEEFDLKRDFSFFILVFLSSFLVLKFIFIVFFNTPFDPPFILHLSPLITFSHITNMQMLIASLFLIILDLYLHIKYDKKNIGYSLIVTALIISGLSVSIAFSEISLDMIVEYLIFISFLIMISFDIQILIKTDSTRSSSSIKRKRSILLIGNKPNLKKESRKTPIRYSVSPVSDLVLIDDIKRDHIDILKNIGIKNIDDLAKIDASKLVKDFRLYMEDLENTISSINKEKIENWIETAKSLINERNKFRNV